jgi:hypothetical protein
MNVVTFQQNTLIKETLVQVAFITLEFKFNAAVGFAEMYLNER